VLLDEASYCWPVRSVWTVQPVRCLYGPFFKGTNNAVTVTTCMYKHNTKYTPSGEKRQSCEVCLNASEKFMCILYIITFKNQLLYSLFIAPTQNGKHVMSVHTPKIRHK